MESSTSTSPSQPSGHSTGPATKQSSPGDAFDGKGSRLNDGKDSQETSILTSETPLPKLQKTASWLVKDKLSREFQNVNDESELGKLMGDDGERLLNLIDDIKRIESLRSTELQIPQLVVVGGTSTGKSSVLQALTRLPFPVSKALCTRFVTETTIRRCGASERPGYKIEVTVDNSGNYGYSPFSPRTFNSDKWTDVYQSLKEDIAYAFDMMSPENLRPPGLSRRELQTNRAKSSGQRPDMIPQLLKHKLQISVQKPDQAHFSIVDIPGIFSSGATSDIKLSRELASKYMQNPEAILLAVTPADNELENQEWWNLAEEAKALDRTIGVITKCDKIGETDEEHIFARLRNQVGSPFYLKLGWYAVRNRSSKEIIDEETFEERDQKETELFQTGAWEEATGNSINRSVLGIKYLKLTLQRNLYIRAKENFPKLRIKMRVLQVKFESEIQGMGDPRDNARDQRVYLTRIQYLYEDEVNRSLTGEYRHPQDPNHVSHLRHHVKEFNKSFELEMRIQALKYSWQEADNEQNPGIFQWILETWDTITGSEGRFDAPRNLKKLLFKEQTHSWETKAREYIDKVEKAVRECNADLFKFACDDDEALVAKIRKMLQPIESQAFKSARVELQNILQDCDYTDSWNPQLEQDIAQLQRARAVRQVQRQSSQKAKLSTAPIEPLEWQVLEHEEFSKTNKKVYEVHDWLVAYWRVAYPRFVDNIIIQVVERHLLGENGPLKLFSRKWISYLEGEDLGRLVGEEEVGRERRRALKQKLGDLKHALEKAEAEL